MKETVPAEPKAHALSLENRARAVITGVEDVDLFNEQMIVAVTTQGTLTLAGQGLHVESLNLGEGRLIAVGKIELVEYGERAKKARGALGKIFR